MTIREKLAAIQTQLKVPKNLYNSFGKYNYRNLEGILEAVKPYLEKYNLALVLYDEITVFGDRVYVCAVASLLDIEANNEVTVRAYAREAATKKGMDDSQVTGTASSYARKYALSGLFLLDDTKDADTDEYHKQTNRTTKKKDEPAEEDIEVIKNMPIGKTRAVALAKSLNEKGISAAFVCGYFGINKLSDMTEQMLFDANRDMEKIKKAQEGDR